MKMLHRPRSLSEKLKRVAQWDGRVGHSGKEAERKTGTDKTITSNVLHHCSIGGGKAILRISRAVRSRALARPGQGVQRH
jgi:hypothetical protein